MMRVGYLALAAIMMCSLSACGVKGKLKSPAQIETLEAKKARKAAKAEQQEGETQGTNPPPPVVPGSSELTTPPRFQTTPLPPVVPYYPGQESK